MEPLDKLANMLDLFRKIDSSVSTQAIAVFLEVARQEGRCLTQLAETLGMTLSSVSRHAYALSAVNYRRKPGMNLVVHKDSPTSWREKQLWLTPQGLDLKKALEALDS